jgi:2-iminobutanoate/2-iminopropanoate deaminase
MKTRRGLSICAFLLSVWVSGCGTTGFSLPWVPQGPGETPAEAKARREAEAAAPRQPAPGPQAVPEPVPARRLGVPNELVSQAPIPPNTAPMPSPGISGSEPVLTAGGYTQATRYGDLLFISGQIAIDIRNNQFRGEATVEEQTRVVMDNIRLILESHRMTMANLVSVTVYVKKLGDVRAMSSVYDTYFRGTPPSRSIVEVSALPRNALLEISAVAGR